MLLASATLIIQRIESNSTTEWNKGNNATNCCQIIMYNDIRTTIVGFSIAFKCSRSGLGGFRIAGTTTDLTVVQKTIRRHVTCQHVWRGSLNDVMTTPNANCPTADDREMIACLWLKMASRLLIAQETIVVGYYLSPGQAWCHFQLTASVQQYKKCFRTINLCTTRGRSHTSAGALWNSPQSRWSWILNT